MYCDVLDGIHYNTKGYFHNLVAISFSSAGLEQVLFNLKRSLHALAAIICNQSRADTERISDSLCISICFYLASPCVSLLCGDGAENLLQVNFLFFTVFVNYNTRLACYVAVDNAN